MKSYLSQCLSKKKCSSSNISSLNLQLHFTVLTEHHLNFMHIVFVWHEFRYKYFCYQDRNSCLVLINDFCRHNRTWIITLFYLTIIHSHFVKSVHLRFTLTHVTQFSYNLPLFTPTLFSKLFPIILWASISLGHTI